MERDEERDGYKVKAEHFNSRAHVERDFGEEGTKERLGISTHALTWSATSFASPSACIAIPFQLTRSRGARLADIEENKDELVNFNSRAHVERDNWH